jgi:hypothetical protein
MAINQTLSRADIIFSPKLWPTKADLVETTAMLLADTVLQILHGDAYYYGPAGETLPAATRGWHPRTYFLVTRSHRIHTQLHVDVI